MTAPITYDEENDILYVLLSPESVARTVHLDDLRLVDVDNDGREVGIEFIGASDGLNLAGVRSADDVRSLLNDAGLEFPVHA